jgi:hypothetical protein
MKVHHDRFRKGQRKMRGLIDEIHRFSDACRTVTGGFVRGDGLELDHIDRVVNALESALVVIRTLDVEVFQESDPSAYAAMRRTDPQGRVPRALTPPRNNAVHHVDIIDPDLKRAVGPIDERYIIFPRWKDRIELPIEMFQYNDKKRKGRLRADYVNSYDGSAAGRLVLDALMDAFAFFDRCDPSIADRDADGKFLGFPLAPLPIAEYHRLSPDWPDHDVVDRNIRAQATASMPAGSSRQIIGCLKTDSGPVYCGHTTIDSRTASFTESAQQVREDIELRYVYETLVDDVTSPVAVQGDELVSGSLSLDAQLPQLTGKAAEPWSRWWELCESDASYYRSQRRAL